MLTRMRQVALHPGLIPPNYVRDLKNMGMDDSASIHLARQLTPEEKMRLQSLLVRALEDFEECPICFGVLHEPRVTHCGHMFCLPWYV